jgi:Clathrin light chain
VDIPQIFCVATDYTKGMSVFLPVITPPIILIFQDTNRSEEQILLESLESEVDAANTWDRVAKLIDVTNDTTIPNNADVTRMRKLFIQLKNEPLEATRTVMA